jgi:hypothetical protein
MAAIETCQYVDVELQQEVASRLLHCLAARATKHKLSAEEAVARTREKLIQEAHATVTKKGAPTGVEALFAAGDRTRELSMC